MNASIEGSLKNINKVWQFFEHKGNALSKADVKKVLQYAKKKGYKSTSDITDLDFDLALRG